MEYLCYYKWTPPLKFSWKVSKALEQILLRTGANTCVTEINLQLKITDQKLPEDYEIFYDNDHVEQ